MCHDGCAPTGALTDVGRSAEGRVVLEGVLGCASNLNLFGEQIDPGSREVLGNFPQGPGHLGLVMAAVGYTEATHRGAAPGPQS